MSSHGWPRWWLAAPIAMAICLEPTKVAAAENVTVDLELVLAVDISLSMDEDEQRLQRDGYTAAFRTLIDGADTAIPFADKLAAAPIETNSRTSISGALIYASGLFDDNGYEGRRAIDVSGDGANNQGIAVEVARDAAVRQGITINGLPLLLKPSGFDSDFETVRLDDYYKDCVIGGMDAFIIPIRNVSEFVPTIRRKLILEITRRDLPVRHIAATAPRSRSDCLIGEKLWKQWMDRFYKE